MAIWHIFQTTMVGLLVWIAVFSSAHAACIGKEMPLEAVKAELEAGRLMSHIAEQEPFHGLAVYLNNAYFFRIADGEAIRLDAGTELTLGKGEGFAATGRFNALIIPSERARIQVGEKDFRILSNDAGTACLTTKNHLSALSPELDSLRYAHLWLPFAALSKLVEWALVHLHDSLVSHWGLALLLFSLLLKILLLPVSLMTARYQTQVSHYRAILAPRLAEIKERHDGEEAHKRLMAAHAELGITPFYTLKPMLGAFIQIPILIAVFNALGEMPQFAGQTLLWIRDLAYPDAIASLPLALPLFGDKVSLLPFLMTAITLLSTKLFQNIHATEREAKRQKRNLYLMAAAFFVLFYPFPAAMVLFWTMNNLIYLLQQQYMSRRG